MTKEIDPIRAELASLKEDIKELKSRPGNSSSSLVDQRRLMSVIARTDPSSRQIAFVGFPGDVEAKNRLTAISIFMEKLCVKFENMESKPQFGHFYKGPPEKRVLSPASYIQFETAEDAEDLLSKIGKNKFECRGATIAVKRATSDHLSLQKIR